MKKMMSGLFFLNVLFLSACSSTHNNWESMPSRDIAGSGGSGERALNILLPAKCTGPKTDITLLKKDNTSESNGLEYKIMGTLNGKSVNESVRIFYNDDAFGRDIEQYNAANPKEVIWALNENTSSGDQFKPTNEYILSVRQKNGKYRRPVAGVVVCDDLGSAIR